MSNHTIFERNVMLGMSDEAADLFGRLLPRIGARVAEYQAQEWDRVRAVLDVAIPAATRICDAPAAVGAEIRTFVRERFFNMARSTS